MWRRTCIGCSGGRKIPHHKICGGPATGGTWFERDGVVPLTGASDYDLAQALPSTDYDVEIEWVKRWPDRPCGEKAWAQEAHNTVRRRLEEKCPEEVIDLIACTNIKSHSELAIQAAWLSGKTIWSFDSGTSGLDDLLIYDPDDRRESIEEDLIAHFEIESWPDEWSLTRVTDERDKKNEED